MISLHTLGYNGKSDLSSYIDLIPRPSLLCLPWSLGERPWLVKKSVGREGWQNVLVVAMTNFVGFKTSSVLFVPYVLVYHTYIIYLSAQCRLGN